MKVTLTIQHLKDKTKIKKRVMMTTIQTDIPGMERINSVGELPDDSPLAKEVDYIVTETMKMQTEKIKKDNKDKKEKFKKKKGLLSKIFNKKK